VKRHEVIIVGGGPAGSACAARLVAAGRDVLVLDREVFPRTKLCAGWITPEVVRDLELDPAVYPHRFNTFDGIVVHLKGLRFTLSNPQHSIRRYEFDAWLLERSGAPVARHTVREVQAADGGYTLDGTWHARYVVGAGGTRCPVYRCLFRDANPRATQLQAATLEQEFPYDWSDERCHLWFFDKGLPGYSWYVPKADGWLNCGLGAMATRLNAGRWDIRAHWRHFTGVLERAGVVTGAQLEPKGYSYFLRGNVDTVRIGNAFLTGDAAGLATRDLCEGIGPAIRSGQRAAAAIVAGEHYRLDDLDAYSAGRGWARWALERMFAGAPPG
jgi:flavin-dependent dehydrogenase